MLIVALFGIFSVGFTITLLAVSLGTIADDLHSSAATLTWVITGPLLAFGVVGPVAGKAGDLWGHKRVYLVGIAGATLFALGTAGAWDATSIIAFRILGAAAGSACGPVAMAMINSVFPSHKRARAMGWWSMVVAGGPVLGVVVGGPIVEALSWRWVFVGQVPLGVVAFVAASLVLPASSTPPSDRGGVRVAQRLWSAFDLPGAVLLASGVSCVLLALNRASAWGWTSPAVLGGFGLGSLLVVGFVKQEARASHPLISLAYLRDRNVAAPAVTQLLANFAYMGGFIVTPFFLAEAFGYGPTRIGLLSISRPLAFAIASPLGGSMAMRVGERRAAMSGALLVTASMLALALVRPGIGDLAVVGALALSGVGLGLMSPAMVATVANAVAPGDLGVVGATQQLGVQVGVVAGIQLLQTTQAGLLEHVGLVDSYRWAYLVGALAAGGSIACASLVRSTAPASSLAGASVAAEVVDVMPPVPRAGELSS